MRKIKKFIAVVLLLSLTGCANEINDLQENVIENIFSSVQDDTDTSNEETTSKSDKKKDDDNNVTHIVIKESPDKYTWYIKDYVGKNCATIGYTSLGGDRRDTYGSGNVKLVFIAEDHSYVDIEDEDFLKGYVVTGQNLEPNTEMKLTFEIDSNGEEYSSLVATQSYDEIVLSVKKVGEKNSEPGSLTKINAAPDKYTRYIADYTGRNLANCGYTSLGGERRDEYGSGNIKLNLISNDGSYIDVEDEEMLKQYYVTSQSIEPNTEIKFEFMKDDDGNEYDFFMDSQSIEEIDLYVEPIE
ncbi:MAG: hypothetical protein NC253_06330 [Ruminococcus sp.]|nr:hypothetical protein [Ruminococcus sp.]MCM1380793.1 hypothetical protein [Muribaculaceae bacterium]MCM1478486.1 hypothetical protein [Muribaculaceae bacterium]